MKKAKSLTPGTRFSGFKTTKYKKNMLSSIYIVTSY